MIRPYNVAQSRKAFEQTRKLSIDGFSDPLELGVASLGEQARVARTEGDWNSAIELYAAQNRHGSGVGYTSLKLLVADLLAMPEAQLKPLLDGKPVQQLITASLISRLNWSFGDQPPAEQKMIKLLQASTRGSLQHADVLVQGGIIRAVGSGLSAPAGASVVEAAAQLRADLYLMGVTGVHAEAGLTTGDFEEAAVKRALHQRAAETVVLASLDKLGAASPFSVAPLRELSALVVPAATPDAMRKKLRAGGARLETAAE